MSSAFCGSAVQDGLAWGVVLAWGLELLHQTAEAGRGASGGLAESLMVPSWASSQHGCHRVVDLFTLPLGAPSLSVQQAR